MFAHPQRTISSTFQPHEISALNKQLSRRSRQAWLQQSELSGFPLQLCELSITRSSIGHLGVGCQGFAVCYVLLLPLSHPKQGSRAAVARRENGVLQEGGKPERTATALVPKCRMSGCRVHVPEQDETAVQRWKLSESCTHCIIQRGRVPYSHPKADTHMVELNAKEVAFAIYAAFSFNTEQKWKLHSSISFSVFFEWFRLKGDTEIDCYCLILRREREGTPDNVITEEDRYSPLSKFTDLILICISPCSYQSKTK